MSVARVYARAALAGNPSDGYGGAVCSVVLPFFSATARVVDHHQTEPENNLVAATRIRFAEYMGAEAALIGFETSIPRSVGLAGSSAIVIATIRALATHHAIALSDMAVAEMAYLVERIDLGIAGGWQDQLIQSHGVSSLMEFAESRRLIPLVISTGAPIPLYVAWSHEAAEASGSSHRRLQAERHEGDPDMAALAELGRDAAAAIVDRRIHDLKCAIDATFDIRTRLMDIPPRQQAMINVARSLGAAANFAGSGGAIAGVLPKEGDEFRCGMRDAGLSIETWEAT